jgi:gluconolactonase
MRPTNERLSRGFLSVLPSAFGLCLLAGCSAADTDEADGVPSYRAPGLSGVAGSGASIGVGPNGMAGAATSAGGTGGLPGRSSEGMGGNITNGLGSAGASMGVAQNVGGSQNNLAGASNLGGAGSQLANGGSGGSAPILPAGSPGRVGAELCPTGNFGNPLPANIEVTPLASVGDNNFFNWEGIVWTGDALYFSEIANGNASQINRYTLDGRLERGVFVNTGSNGLAIDAAGNLLLAAHDVGGISSVTLPGGVITRGGQTRDGMRFNSPNDLVLRNDGNIYFTDPDFQSPGGRIQGDTRVYRIAPPAGAGEISVVDESLDNPNGVTLSPDGNTLYIAGSGTLRAFTLDAAGTPTFAFDSATRLEVADGMTVDCAGNVYAVENAARRVRVFDPAGVLIGTIGPDGFGNQGLTNVAFGGPNRTTLFVSSFSQAETGGLYSIELDVPGLPY